MKNKIQIFIKFLITNMIVLFFVSSLIMLFINAKALLYFPIVLYAIFLYQALPNTISLFLLSIIFEKRLFIFRKNIYIIFEIIISAMITYFFDEITNATYNNNKLYILYGQLTTLFFILVLQFTFFKNK